MARIALLTLAAGLLAGCNGIPNPYLKRGNTTGTPADRTGGAKMPGSGAGAAPGKNQ